MSITEALKLLEAVETKKNGNTLKKSIIVGIARAGSDNPVVKADYMNMLNSFEFGALPHVLIVPGKLHFMEKEALIKIAHAPEDM
jgi:diphthine synthase